MTELVPVTRTIVDYPDRLASYLRTTSAAGRLLTAAEDITPTALESGKFAIRVTVHEPAPELTWRERRVRFDKAHPIASPCLKALAFGVSVVLFVAGAGFAVFEVGYHAIGAHTIGKALGAIAVAAAVIALIHTALFGGDGGHKGGEGFHWSKCK